MKRKRSLMLSVMPALDCDYRGNPWVSFLWMARDGVSHQGRPFIDSLIGSGLGMVPKPGDRIRVTVEINPED